MTDHLLPDFTDRLEERLRRQARAHQQTGWVPVVRRWTPRLALPVIPAIACIALAVLLFGAGASDTRRVPAAYGKPLVLNTPPVDADQLIRHLSSGLMAKVVFGPHPQLTAARPVPVLGGTAYVVTGPSGWCLTAPDRKARPADQSNPARAGAVTCSRIDEVISRGIVLGVGRDVIAALPSGAQAPTLARPGEPNTTLSPNSQGVVQAPDLPAGSVITLYAADGSKVPFRIP